MIRKPSLVELLCAKIYSLVVNSSLYRYFEDPHFSQSCKEELDWHRCKARLKASGFVEIENTPDCDVKYV